MVPLNVGEIPSALRDLDQWVCWSWAWNALRSQWDKPPKQPSGRASSTTNQETWVSFEAALQACEQGTFDGVGFVLVEEAGIVGVDLDDCSHDGKLEDWATQILGDLRTYTELSPSGTGVRAFCRAKLPGSGRKRGPVEVYQEGRYLTVTGHRIGRSRTLRDCDAEVERLWASLESTVTTPPPPRPVSGVSLSDFELLEKARQAKNGAEFWSLFTGNLGGRPSSSEADLALSNHLAFWTNRDPTRIDRLFRASGLMRPKWDERRGSETYGELTITKAIESTREGYSDRSEQIRSRTPSPSEPERQPSQIVVRTFAELQQMPAAEVDWIVERFLAQGGISELSAWVKVGKSTLMAQLVSSVLSGKPFLGQFEAIQGPVMLLTEERQASLAAALEEADVDPEMSNRLHVVLKTEQFGLPWEVIVRQAADTARQLGCRALVIDTLGTWTGVEDENDAAAATRCMLPVQEVAHGLAILVLRQARKTFAETQNSGRGSSAYAGAMDILLHLQHTRDERGRLNEDDPQRWLSVISRYERDLVPRMLLTYDHRTYRAVEATALDQSSTAQVLEDLRTHGPSRPLEVSERTGLRHGTTRVALLRLVRQARAEVVNGIYAAASAERTPDSTLISSVTPVTPGVTPDSYSTQHGVTPVTPGVTPVTPGVTPGVTPVTPRCNAEPIHDDCNVPSSSSGGDDHSAMGLQNSRVTGSVTTPLLGPLKGALGGAGRTQCNAAVTPSGDVTAGASPCRVEVDGAGLAHCRTHLRTLGPEGTCPAISPHPPSWLPASAPPAGGRG